ncbi:MAG TPA: hypothetical protein DCR61_04460 [Verrucomicrobiales bacterium]|nr:hypothetical protein [Verrucomicrobiales bacterium]
MNILRRSHQRAESWKEASFLDSLKKGDCYHSWNWMSFKALLRQPDEVLQTTAGCHSSIPQNYSGFSFLRDPIDHEHEKFDI